MKIFKAAFFVVVVWFLNLGSANANMDQVKVYKEAFPDEKPKCNYCHIQDVPKKEEGMHDLDEYGLKAKESKKIPDAETYKALGSYTVFKTEKQ